MKSLLQVGGIEVEVVLKEIKNIHLSVHPPKGRVTVAAPAYIKLENIRLFVLAKVAWIREQQKRLQLQDRETTRVFLNRESHYVWGERYLLKLVEVEAPPSIELQHGRILFQTRPGTDVIKKQEILDEWYRGLVREAVQAKITKWEKKIGVAVNKVFIQKMKTKWGSCNSVAGNIRLNTDLAKKPSECLEYILVHELLHLIEPSHNDRFIKLMGQVMPKWRSHRQLLNSLPVRNESWLY
jgi:predicted metal-dependent hydrolase